MVAIFSSSRDFTELFRVKKHCGYAFGISFKFFVSFRLIRKQYAVSLR